MSTPPPGPAKRFLALDPGERRTGLAATDWTGTLSVPLGRAATGAFGAGIALLAAGILAGSEPLAVLGAATYALAAVLTLSLHGRMALLAVRTGPLPRTPSPAIAQ